MTWHSALFGDLIKPPWITWTWTCKTSDDPHHLVQGSKVTFVTLGCTNEHLFACLLTWNLTQTCSTCLKVVPEWLDLMLTGFRWLQSDFGPVLSSGLWTGFNNQQFDLNGILKDLRSDLDLFYSSFFPEMTHNTIYMTWTCFQTTESFRRVL